MPDNVDLDNKQLENQESEDAFSAGFAEVRASREHGEQHEQEPEPQQDQEQPTQHAKQDEPAKQSEPAPETAGQEAESPPVAAAQPQPEDNKEFAKISKRMRDLEGRMGGLMTKLDSTLARMGQKSPEQSTPTQQELSAALGDDDEEIRAFENEYHELKPIISKMRQISKGLQELQQQANAAPQHITQEQVTEVVEASTDRKLESARLQDAHSDWQQIATSDGFIVFALSGGPSINHYAAYRAMHPQDQERLLSQWQEQYPDWWNEKGKGIFSASAADAIGLISQYKEQNQKPTQDKLQPDPEELKRKQREDAKRRLRASVMPQGTSTAEPTGALSDEEAFAAGFNQVRRQNTVMRH